MPGSVDLATAGAGTATETTSSASTSTGQTQENTSGNNTAGAGTAGNASQAQTQQTQGASNAVGTTSTGSGTTGETFTVGDKAYTKEQVTEALNKIGRYQGDRDRAEAAFEKIVTGLQRQGYSVDREFNVVPLAQKPNTPDINTLTALAAAGDTTSLQQLMEINRQETAREVIGTIQKAESEQRIVQSVKEQYPDFYTKEGQPNPDSPLFKEASKILEEHPHLAGVQFLPVLAEAAQGRLIKNNFKTVEQNITNRAHETINRGFGQTVQMPATGQQTEQNILSPEQLAYAQKLGVSADRLAKIAERVSEKGGYTL
jgi:hypothetical protein